MSKLSSQNPEELVARYLGGKLSDEEAKEFEEHFLDKDDLLDRLETGWVIREGLADGAASDARETSSRWRWAAAAGLVAALGLSLVIVRQSSELSGLRDQVAETGVTPARSMIARISPMRSSADTAVDVTVDYAMPAAVLVLELTLPEASQFDVTIVDVESGVSKVEVDAVPVQGIGDLVLLLPTESLPPGSYEAVVEGDESERVTFQFDVSALD